MTSWSPPPSAILYGALLLTLALTFLFWGGIARLLILFTPSSSTPFSTLPVPPPHFLFAISALALTAWLTPTLLPAGGLLVGLTLLSLAQKKPIAFWGLSRPNPLADLLLSLRTVLTLFLPILFLLIFSSALFLILGFPLEPQPAMTRFLEARDAQTLLPFLTYALVIAPIWEEIFFRGTLFPWLAHRLPIQQAQWLSALAFGAVHLHAPTLIPLTFLGAALAGVFRTSQSLIPCVLIHSLFNANTCILILLARPPLP